MRHQFFGKLLAGFYLRSRLGMTENRNSCLTKSISDTGCQCRFRSYDAEVYLLCLGES